MLTLEDQFTKALTEMDTNSKLTLHMTNGKEMVIVHTDLLSIGAETVKIIRRLNQRTSRGNVRIIPYNKIEYITYTINPEIYEVYVEKSLPASEVNEDNIPTDEETTTPQTENTTNETENTGDVEITVINNEDFLLKDVEVTITNGTNTYTETTGVTGTVSFESVKYGTYTVTLTSEGYVTKTEELIVDADDTLESYTLNKQYTGTTPTLDEEEGIL